MVGENRHSKRLGSHVAAPLNTFKGILILAINGGIDSLIIISFNLIVFAVWILHPIFQVAC